MQTAGHSGLASVKWVQQQIGYYPALLPVTLFLKQFLKQGGMNESYTGGLSSYALLNMVAYSIFRNDDRDGYYGYGRQLTCFGKVLIDRKILALLFLPMCMRG
jgi:DNA polymerase sigma